MAVRFIGKAFVYQARNHLYHMRDMIGRFGLMRGRQAANGSEVFIINARIFFGNDRDINALLFGRFDNLIINIGYIAGINNMVFSINMPQHAE